MSSVAAIHVPTRLVWITMFSLVFPLVVSYAAPVPVIEHSAPALVVTNVQRERTKARSLTCVFICRWSVGLVNSVDEQDLCLLYSVKCNSYLITS